MSSHEHCPALEEKSVSECINTVYTPLNGIDEHKKKYLDKSPQRRHYKGKSVDSGIDQVSFPL